MPTIKILVIDDDDVDRERFRRLIARTALQAEVFEAGSGRQGMEMLRTERFDCVVLDYQLGDTTGTDLVRQIRQIQRRPFPIIMITGLGDEQIAVEAMREGVFDYLIKSQVDAKRLAGTIEGSLRWATLESELQDTRERLLDQTRLLQSIMNHIGDGITVADADGRFLMFNPAAEEILGRGTMDGGPALWAEGYGLLLADQVTPCPVEDVPLARALRGEVVGGVELYVRRPAGQPGVFIRCRARPLLDEHDAIKGAVAAFHDITESHKLAHLKDEFISTVSHELRTPLTSIRGSLGLIAAGLMGPIPAEAQQMLEIAVSNTDRLVRLINDILDIERMESGRVPMEKRDCQAGELMTEAGEGLLPLAGEAGVALEVSPCAVPLWADPDRIVQVLTNLLGNAIKFSPPDSTIRLSCERKGDELVLAVTDQGRGIPADKLESIFGRFQQVDASDARDKGGTGLGLAICQTIAHQHGGRLWVESELGRGSTFFFALPLPPQCQAGPAGPAAPKTVLVCDDDSAMNEVVCEALEEHGYRVIAVTSGREAVAQAMARRPDAILLDMMMPQMDGWETMAALKEHPETRDIPIAVHSATKQPADLADRKQIAAWVEKSGDIPRLLRGLQRALEQGVDGCCVMLVEDDPDLARVLTTVFEQQGIATAHVRTAQEAIRLLDRTIPDLIVLDVAVPGGGGFAVAAWLRQREGYRHLPLVVYSAKDLDPAERQQIDLGGTLFLTKGRVSPELLEKKVRAILDQERLASEAARPIP